MKKIPSYLLLVIFMMVQLSCSKDVPNTTDNAPMLAPTKTDIDAGLWRPILLTGPTEFPVAAPAAVTTPGYIAELNEIKGYQRDLTASQEATIKYWGAGGVLRWNELMRQLVSKYNLPPYQNADGTYPFPSANNPFAYPLFPFANPPYAARAYAYVSAAQYDALVLPGIIKNYTIDRRLIKQTLPSKQNYLRVTYLLIHLKMRYLQVLLLR